MKNKCSVGRWSPLLTLIITLSFSLHALAESEYEKNENIERIKIHKQKVEEQIAGLPDMTDCGDKSTTLLASGKSEQLTCVEDKLKDLTEEQVKKIEQGFELKTHSLVKSDDKKEVVKYLMKTLTERIHGKGADKKKNKEKEYLSQTDYFKLYSNQLSQTTMLEVASFCREKVEIRKNTSGVGYDITSAQIKEKTDAEIAAEHNKVGAFISGKNDAAQFHQTCLASIHLICKNYTNDPSRNPLDRQACLFKDRLSKIKTALETSEKIQNGLNGQVAAKGFDITTTYKDFYDGSRNDEITAITSDMAMNDEFKKIEGKRKEYEQKCEIEKSEECRKYLSLLSQKDYEKIQFEALKKQAIQNKAIELMAQDEERLRTYAKQYGIEDINIADIKTNLNKEFEAQKQAIIAQIKEEVIVKDKKEEELEKIKFDDLDDRTDKPIAKNSYTKEDTMRDNIFYANMVNSYLVRQDSQTGVKSQNKIYRDREFAAAQASGDQKYFKEIENYKKLIENNDKTSGRDIASESSSGSGIGILTSGIFEWILTGKPREESQQP